MPCPTPTLSEIDARPKPSTSVEKAKPGRPQDRPGVRQGVAVNELPHYSPAMTLEDHVGDILKKARLMRQLTAADVARTAGLTEAEWADLETSGVVGKTPNWTAAAAALGLHAGKLQQVAAGWIPAPADLSIWREIRQITTQEGMSVHAYLVWDEVTREAALFDTGWTVEPVFTLVAQEQLQLKHLFITHSHHDHIGAITPLRERFPKIRIHTNSKAAPIDQRNRANDFVHLGSLRITNRDTSGHAEDGVTYVIGNFPEDAPNLAIVGDAIFAGSMGGAPGLGDVARQKVRDQILNLPPATLLCPGHGPLTTVEQEKEHNPFF